MSGWTRLTITGSTRRAEVVVPSGEPLGALLPRLMDLLEERSGEVSRPLALVRITGEQLDLARGLADQGVDDGELVRLVREDQAPPPPEVSDVTDVLADAHDGAEERWSPAARRWTAAAALLLLSAALSVVGGRLDPRLTLPIGAAVLVLCVLAAIVAGRLGAPRAATALAAIALGAVPVTAALLVPLLGPVAARMPAITVPLVVAGLGWAVLALALGAGTARLPVWWAGVLGLVLSALPVLLLLAGVLPVGALGIGLVAATVACGLLPWYAMSASRLTGLDDQVVEGRRGRRDVALASVDEAYRTLSWAAWAVAVPIGVLSTGLLASGEPWAAGLAAAGLVVTASRTRTMPFTVQAVALWLAVLVPLGVGAVVQPPLVALWAVPALAALLVVAFIAGLADPAEHRRAALRRAADLIETVAVVAQLPLLVGAFGLYAQLLQAFG